MLRHRHCSRPSHGLRPNPMSRFLLSLAHDASLQTLVYETSSKHFLGPVTTCFLVVVAILSHGLVPGRSCSFAGAVWPMPAMRSIQLLPKLVLPRPLLQRALRFARACRTIGSHISDKALRGPASTRGISVVRAEHMGVFWLLYSALFETCLTRGCTSEVFAFHPIIARGP